MGIKKCREKSKYLLTSIKCLGYEISYNILRPDPDRLSAVKRIKIPKDKLTVQRLMGFFAYYIGEVHLDRILGSGYRILGSG
ncbi:hypothetical protein GJ496_005326 [Pomphorhynchus laevis]|nr:hypothetical protein GJ496_005326 [Pomphorhynchus laevis]